MKELKILILVFGIFSYQNVSCSSPLEEQRFQRNMESFMRSNIITTWYPSRLTGGSCPALRNGQVNRFGLNRVTDRSAYSIYPRGNGGITAYWLDINKPITIPRRNSVVITPELNGCSIYVKANPDRRTVTIYHHYREFEKPGNGQKQLTRRNGKYLVEGSNLHFDDVLAWENYGDWNQQSFSIAEKAFCGIAKGKVDQGSVEHLQGTHVTAFLQGDQNGDMHFIWQKFRNAQQTDRQNELVNFRIEGRTRKTKVNLAPILAPPPSARTRRPRPRPRSSE